MPDDFTKEFSNLFKENRTVGTLSESQTSSLTPSVSTMWFIDTLRHQVPKFSQRGVFTECEIVELKYLYSNLLDIPVTAIEAPNSNTSILTLTER